jgi:hypothetical protein
MWDIVWDIIRTCGTFLNHPSHILHNLAGRPQLPPSRKIINSDNACCVCGERASSAITTKSAFGSSFTDYDLLDDPTSDNVCVPCAWVMSGKPPDTFRMWSVLYRSDGVRLTHSETFANYDQEKIPSLRSLLGASCLSMTNRGHARQIIDALTCPPDSTWFLSLTTSGQIHTVPFAKCNDGHRYTVRLERALSRKGTMYTHREIALRLGPELVDALKSEDPQASVSAILDDHAARDSVDWDLWAEVDKLLDEDGGVDDLLRVSDVRWDVAMQLDPIPPWSLRAAIAHLVDTGAIEASGEHDQGQSKFARMIDVNPRTVRRWLSGDNPCERAQAEVVRMRIAGLIK